MTVNCVDRNNSDRFRGDMNPVELDLFDDVANNDGRRGKEPERFVQDLLNGNELPDMLGSDRPVSCDAPDLAENFRLPFRAFETR